MSKLRIALLGSLIFLSACAPKSDLDSAKKKIVELEAENARLKAEISRPPELPISISFRKALLGSGYVAVIKTTIKKSFPVLAIVNSSALGTTKQFELHLASSSSTELGHMEGATLERGDTITLKNANYSPATFRIETD